jgi:hypothetical protein
MQKERIELGEAPLIKIDAIGGDLRVSGHDESYLEVQAPDSGNLKVTEEKGGALVICRSGCLIFMPRSGRIEAGEVGGDCRITDVEGEVLLQTVGGDLSLRRVGKASFELIGGDMQARRLMGDLAVDHVGGDAVVQEIEGGIRMRMVGGDVLLGEVAGMVDVSCGGDALVSFDPPGGQASKVQAGSDLDCRVSPQASVRVKAQAGGDREIGRGFETDADEGVFLLGSGEAELELSAGGDLVLRLAGASQGFGGFDFADVLSDMDVELAEMETKMDSLAVPLEFGVKEKVRRAVRNARRSARKARHHHFKLEAEFDPLKGITFQGPGWAGFGESPQEATEEERHQILRMVEQGKITVDEAEALLEALEGES